MFRDRLPFIFGVPVSRVVWREGLGPLRIEPFAGNPNMEWLKFILEPRSLPMALREEWKNFILHVVVVGDSIWFYKEHNGSS